MNHLISGSLHKTFFWLTIASIVFLTACQGTGPHQAYEGPEKTDSEVATFTVPGQYNLLSIDAVHYQQAMLKDGAIVKLLPGSHQFIIEYKDFWNLNGEQHEKIVSKPMAITFTAQAGIQYSINAAPLESVEQAQAFAKKPSISIVDTTNNQEVTAKIKYNLYGQGLFTTLFGASKPESTAIQYSTKETDTPNKGDNALEMLKVWWKSADEKQQSDFRQWLKNQ